MAARSHRRLHFLGTVAAATFAAFVTLRYCDIHGYQDYVEYQAACRHALGRRLWFGDIQAGDDIRRLLNEAQPNATHQLQGWSWAYYDSQPDTAGVATRLVLTAHRGKLVDAYLSNATLVRSFIRMTEQEDVDCSLVMARDYYARIRANCNCSDINP